MGLRTYYVLLVAQTVSLLGSQISALAVSISIFRQTGHATPLALVAFCSAAPAIALSGFSGALADRFDRRRIMLAANIGFVAASGLLLLSFASRAFRLWHLYVLALASSLFAALDRPAFQASVAMLGGVRQETHLRSGRNGRCGGELRRPGCRSGRPTRRVSGPIRGVGPLSILTGGHEGGAIGPAGSIYASADDMAAWLRVQLAHGALPGGRRLFSAAASAKMWSPQVVVPITPPPVPVALTAPNFEDYGLGFFIQDYRGHKIITHSGAILGGLSAVAIVPEKNVAFAVMINSEDSGARWSLFYHLLDYYLGLPSPDWPARWQVALDQVHGAALKRTATAQGALHSERGPSLPLAGYVGVYRDPWYGAATITRSADGGLRLRFDETPGMEGSLEHVQVDTFRVHWTDRDIEDAYVTFDLDAKGAIAAVAMTAVSPTADFSFDYQDLHFVPVGR